MSHPVIPAPLRFEASRGREYVSYIERLRRLVRSLGRRPLGWQETARAGLGPDDVIQYWLSGTALPASLPPRVRAQMDADLALSRRDVETAAAASVPVIVSPLAHCYLDVPYAEPSADPAQADRQRRLGLRLYAPQTVAGSFDWEPGETLGPGRDAQVAGVEAAVWAETISGFDDLSFLLLPRLPGVADKAWSAPRATGWAGHRDRLARHGRLWAQDGLTYFRPAHRLRRRFVQGFPNTSPHARGHEQRTPRRRDPPGPGGQGTRPQQGPVHDHRGDPGQRGGGRHAGLRPARLHAQDQHVLLRIRIQFLRQLRHQLDRFELVRLELVRFELVRLELLKLRQLQLQLQFRLGRLQLRLLADVGLGRQPGHFRRLVMPRLPEAADTEASARWRALGTLVQLVVTEPACLAGARRLLTRDLAGVDAACSRFRADSEIRALRGGPQRISPLLAEAIAVALRAAELTGGDVDPTVGAAMSAAGYDRDFGKIDPNGPALALTVRQVPGWRQVRLDGQTLTLPARVQLDLGATAKAWAADRSAARIARELGTGVLVSLGGDIAVAGPAPRDGWRIRVQDVTGAPEHPPAGPYALIAIRDGGLATSSTAARRWQRGGDVLHHILDPRTSLPAEPVWRTVSVAAGSCADANAASTAAVVRGRPALGWLARLGLPARLVDATGVVFTVAGWPDESEGHDR